MPLPPKRYGERYEGTRIPTLSALMDRLNQRLSLD